MNIKYLYIFVVLASFGLLGSNIKQVDTKKTLLEQTYPHLAKATVLGINFFELWNETSATLRLTLIKDLLNPVLDDEIDTDTVQKLDCFLKNDLSFIKGHEEAADLILGYKIKLEKAAKKEENSRKQEEIQFDFNKVDEVIEYSNNNEFKLKGKISEIISKYKSKPIRIKAAAKKEENSCKAESNKFKFNMDKEVIDNQDFLINVK